VNTNAASRNPPRSRTVALSARAGRVYGGVMGVNAEEKKALEEKLAALCADLADPEVQEEIGAELCAELEPSIREEQRILAASATLAQFRVVW